MIDLDIVIWLIFGLLAIAAAALPLWVFLRGAPAKIVIDDDAGDAGDDDVDGQVNSDRAPALRVYQDQLAGIDNDVRWGRISDAQAGEMRTEIKRRMLRVADIADETGGAKAMSGVLVSAIVIAGIIGGGAFYVMLGSPQLADLAPRQALQAGGATNADGAIADNTASIEEVLAKLSAHLEDNPDDIRALSLMARSRWQMGQFSAAANAYSRLASLEPDNIEHRISLGEALLDSMGGRFTPAAQLAFEEASRIDPSHPAPNFYAGLSHYQAGDAESALQIWREMAENSPSDAPWMPNLADNIRRAEQQLGVAPEGAMSASAPLASGMPTPDAATRDSVASMTEDERSDFVASMVARLEARLEDEPDDLDGWLNLARAYGVLGRNDDQKDALRRALEVAPDDAKSRIAEEIAALE